MDANIIWAVCHKWNSFRTAGFGFLYLAGSRRYGAATGWLAVLLALGAAGFMVRAHLLTPGVAAFAASAALLWGALLLKTRAFAGGAVCGGALGFVFWSAGIAPAVASALFLLLLFLHREWRHTTAGLLVAAAVALPLLLLWPAVLAQRQPEVFGLWFSSMLPPFAPHNSIAMPALFAWALFPALPIAAAGFFWRRKQAEDADVLAPDKPARMSFFDGGDSALFAAALLFVLASVSLLWGGDISEEGLFFALPAVSFAAARFMRKLPDDAAVVCIAIWIGLRFWLSAFFAPVRRGFCGCVCLPECRHLHLRIWRKFSPVILCRRHQSLPLLRLWRLPFCGVRLSQTSGVLTSAPWLIGVAA